MHIATEFQPEPGYSRNQEPSDQAPETVAENKFSTLLPKTGVQLCQMLSSTTICYIAKRNKVLITYAAEQIGQSTQELLVVCSMSSHNRLRMNSGHWHVGHQTGI